MKVLVLFDLARPVEAGEQFSPRELKEEENKPTEADVLKALKRLGHEVETLGIFDDVLAIIEGRTKKTLATTRGTAQMTKKRKKK